MFSGASVNVCTSTAPRMPCAPAIRPSRMRWGAPVGTAARFPSPPPLGQGGGDRRTATAGNPPVPNPSPPGGGERGRVRFTVNALPKNYAAGLASPPSAAALAAASRSMRFLRGLALLGLLLAVRLARP